MKRKKIKVVLSLAVCVLFITTSFSISAGEVFCRVNNKTSNIHLAMVPSGYPDLSEIIAEMNDASAAYPSICKMVDLTTTYDAPSTYEDRHLYAVKISDNVNEDEDEPTFLMVSCHHCREIVTPVIALYAIEQFTTKYGSDPQITALVDEYEIWITPVWNPDGYEYVFYHDNMWRKNRRYFPEHNSYGVDLNRNYPFGWYSGCSGSTNPSSETYKGPSPASEAETQTMIVFSNDQHFAKVLDYHSSGREVLWGYCCHNHPFDTFFRSEAIRLSTAAGYGGSNRPPSAEGENYQWQLATNGTYANLMETHTSFQPSYSSAQSEAAKVWPGTLWMLERPISLSGHVKDYYNGQPLAANISLCGITFPNGEEFKSEPSFGRYHLFLPPDSYTIEFSAPGYINQSHQITITLDSAEVHDVLLKQINGPPEIPCKPSGQTNGTSGQQYLYTTNTTDPDGDKVFYNFSWGDGNYSDWIGPYNSGETASARYTWTEKGTYEIKVKARDILGKESNWSDPLEVSMPKNQQSNQQQTSQPSSNPQQSFSIPSSQSVKNVIPLTGSKSVEQSSMPTFDEIEDTSGCDCELGCELEIGELTFEWYRITMIIKNIGDSDCTNVKWSITFDGGIILLGRESSGIIICIPLGENATVHSNLIFGFGRTIITVTVDVPESSNTKEQDAFILLFFIKI